MTIGMLGGSFCPPTVAHLELSRRCISEGLCDKVIWVPVNDAYKKDTNIPAKYRNEMVKLMLANEEKISYSLHEQDYDRIVRTLESIKILQSHYPNDKIVFIAGADKMGFKWFQKEEFVRDFGFIVTSREDIDCEAAIASSETLSRWKDNIRIIDFSSEVSSTMVREQLKNTGTSDLISPDVLAYIQKNNLFK